MKNNRPAKVFLSLFFLVSFLDILGVILNNALMQAIFKPMIILSLMAAYFFGTESILTQNIKITVPTYLKILQAVFLGFVHIPAIVP